MLPNFVNAMHHLLAVQGVSDKANMVSTAAQYFRNILSFITSLYVEGVQRLLSVLCTFWPG